MNYTNLDKVIEICKRVKHLNELKAALDGNKINIRIFNDSIHFKTTALWENSQSDFQEPALVYIKSL